jgi:2-phosphosulfolactate phosphatase
MRIDVIELPERLGEADRPTQLFLVVDVLRLCSTMVTAFANGCEAVIPVAEPAEAFSVRERRPEVLLAGERGGYMIEGFDLGNSPFEMTRAAVGGRTMVMCSTNGTKAIVAGGAGAAAIAACFLNASAAARCAQAVGRDVTILCSGKLGATAPEDLACAGLLVEKLEGLAGRSGARLTAGAAEALALYRAHRDDLARFVGECEHGRYLTSIGMSRDVPYCAQVDVFDLVPRLDEGVIRCGRRDALD